MLGSIVQISDVILVFIVYNNGVIIIAKSMAVDLLCQIEVTANEAQESDK
jgi:hypothetical protein